VYHQPAAIIDALANVSSYGPTGLDVTHPQIGRQLAAHQQSRIVTQPVFTHVKHGQAAEAASGMVNLYLHGIPTFGWINQLRPNAAHIVTVYSNHIGILRP